MPQSPRRLKHQVRDAVGEQIRDIPINAARLAMFGIGRALLLSDRVTRDVKEMRESGVLPVLDRLRADVQDATGKVVGKVVERISGGEEPVAEPVRPSAARPSAARPSAPTAPPARRVNTSLAAGSEISVGKPAPNGHSTRPARPPARPPAPKPAPAPEAAPAPKPGQASAPKREQAAEAAAQIKSATTDTARPAAKPDTTAEKAATAPAAKPPAKPAAKTAAKPAAKAPAKPGTTPATKPVAKLTEQATAKPAEKPTEQAAAKPASKASAKPAEKATEKATGKPAATAGSTAAPKATAQPEQPAEPAPKAAAKSGSAISAASLPVPDYDTASVPALRARLRGLSADQVNRLREYERQNAARADVLKMYENRIVKLTGQG